MKYTVICAGRIKESFYADAVAEYVKRLGRYCTVKIEEVADGPDMKAEAERILKKIPEDAYVITLEIEGREFSSEELAGKIEELMTGGKSHFVFIIGGSDGLDKSVRSRADLKVSFSHFTFPHMLMRVILLEQIYRIMKIINGEPYHK